MPFGPALSDYIVQASIDNFDVRISVVCGTCLHAAMERGGWCVGRQLVQQQFVLLVKIAKSMCHKAQGLNQAEPRSGLGLNESLDLPAVMLIVCFATARQPEMLRHQSQWQTTR